MTRVFYGGPPGNGAGVALGLELKVIKTLLCNRKPIFDGPTRIYDEFTYECLAVLNPRATSFKAPDGEAIPLDVLNETATNTDDAIRHFLLNPRRKLKITIGDDTLVESPPAGRLCDAASGPLPYCCDVVSIWGLRTIVVRWGVRCHINPCERVTGNNTTPVLSHRWKQERDIDQDGLSTLITSGHVIFDVGKLLALGRVPDDYWTDLYRPLEKGFRRSSVQVVATEDGDELQYSVTDTEMPVSLLKSRITERGIPRVEATYGSEVSRGDAIEAARQSLKKGNVVEKIGNTISALIPFCTHHINVRAWGYRSVNKDKITTFCRDMTARILLSLNMPGLIKLLGSFANKITWDLMGRWVECSSNFTTPPFWEALTTVETGFGLTERLWPAMPQGEGSINNPNVKNPENLQDIIDEDYQRCPGLPVGRITDEDDKGGGLGIWVGRIVAQQLTRACQRQPVQVANISAKGAITKDQGWVT